MNTERNAAKVNRILPRYLRRPSPTKAHFLPQNLDNFWFILRLVKKKIRLQFQHGPLEFTRGMICKENGDVVNDLRRVPDGGLRIADCGLRIASIAPAADLSAPTMFMSLQLPMSALKLIVTCSKLSRLTVIKGRASMNPHNHVAVYPAQWLGAC